MFKAQDARLSREKVHSTKVRKEKKIYDSRQWKIPPKDESLRPCGGWQVNLFRRTNDIAAVAGTDQSEKRRERRLFETFWAGLLSSGKLDVLIIVTSCHKFCIASRSAIEFTREFSNGSLESVKGSVFWPKKPWLVAKTRSVLRTEATCRPSKLYLPFFTRILRSRRFICSLKTKRVLFVCFDLCVLSSVCLKDLSEPSLFFKIIVKLFAIGLTESCRQTMFT